MFKIVVDKVNKKTQARSVAHNTAYSGFSWPEKSNLPKPAKKEMMFTLSKFEQNNAYYD